jgi:hypothetical protein
MTATLLQLQSTGVQDTYLTTDPQINIFKYSYFRYVNFATETVKLELNESALFNKKITCNILKKGHLLSKLYLHVKLPPLVLNGGTYACWTDALGYAIFKDAIELEIGGVVVDKLYPHFLNMWDEVSNHSKFNGRNLMLLKSDLFASGKRNATKTTNLIIPLEFWFCKQYSSALPLLSMAYQDIKISFKFRNFSELIHYDGSEPESVPILQSSVIAEYIYLDDIILNQFKNQTHTYIIEQIQYNSDEIIPSASSIYNSSLKFNNPVKEFIFACVQKSSIDTNNHFAYSNSLDDSALIDEISLSFEGSRKYEFLPEVYYRTVLPDSAHSVVPIKYIYYIPFSIRPEENQPFGSLNASRFDDIILSFKLPNNNPTSYLYTFALTYNIVKIEKGVLSFEFAV